MDFFKIHRSKILIITIIGIITTILLITINNSYKIPEQLTPNQELPVQNISTEKLFIDVKGEVNNPGVYEITSDIIIMDAINLAGGLTETADTSTINLAAKVTDGMQIVIPSKTTSQNKHTEPNKISINTGSLTQLQTIPGLGPSKAQKIIDYRNKYGYFQSIEEIQNVSGIGKSTYEKLKDYITI